MHKNKESSRYDHLKFNSSNVKEGQKVKQGEKIAEVGMTGYTYIPHLHFQSRYLKGHVPYSNIKYNLTMSFV